MSQPGEFRVYLTIEVHDPNGRRRFYRRYRSRSLLRNFLRAFFGFTSPGLAINNWTVIDLTGANRVIGTAAGQQANGNSIIPAIRFGSGSTPPTVTDFEMETQISGADVDSVVDDSAGDDIEYRFVITFANSSGSTWNVNEVGMGSTVTWAASTRHVLYIRDVLGSQVDVLDGQALTISYSLKTTV